MPVAMAAATPLTAFSPMPAVTAAPTSQAAAAPMRAARQRQHRHRRQRRGERRRYDQHGARVRTPQASGVNSIAIGTGRRRDRLDRGGHAGLRLQWRRGLRRFQLGKRGGQHRRRAEFARRPTPIPPPSAMGRPPRGTISKCSARCRAPTPWRASPRRRASRRKARRRISSPPIRAATSPAYTPTQLGLASTGDISSSAVEDQSPRSTRRSADRRACRGRLGGAADDVARSALCHARGLGRL